MRLASLHWRLAVGDEVIVVTTNAQPGGAPSLADLVIGAGFEIVEVVEAIDERTVLARRALSLPDTVGPRMRVLVCGLNPAIYAAERGIGFARGSNRFWKAAVAAGLTDRERDPGHALVASGMGMTDLCKRATVASSELSRVEYVEGAARVDRLVRWLRPGVVAFVGLEGWRAAVDPRAVAGLQPGTIGGRPAYVLPSTSGLNAHTRFADVVHHLEAVASMTQPDE